MIYRLINTQRSPLARRILATTVITLFPVLILIAILAGLAFSVFEWVKDLYLNLKALFVELVPETLRDLVRVLKTGGNV